MKLSRRHRKTLLVTLACISSVSDAWHVPSPLRRKTTTLNVSSNPLEDKTKTASGNLNPLLTTSLEKRSRTTYTSLSSSTVFPQDVDPLVTRISSSNDIDSLTENGPTVWVDNFLSTYWGPRGLLLVLAAVYATNFPLGALMNDHLPASAATASRMLVAGLALAPFIPQLDSKLRLPAVLCGCFTAMGYVTQSLALQDVDPARVSFLGSCTVLWCPMLEGLIEKKPMSLKDAPQTWLAACLCLAGIGVLELSGGGQESMSMAITSGDMWALLQAVGFGTGVFWTSRMVRSDSSQALPVTATLIATTAFWAMLWCVADGWMGGPESSRMTLPGMAMDESMHTVFLAVLWTGLISTSLNFFIELTALGRVPPSEASVLLASEPLWAAILAAAFYEGSSLSLSDGIGGMLIVGACLVNALVKPEMFWSTDGDESLESL